MLNMNDQTVNNDLSAPDELLSPLLDYLARRLRAEAEADLHPFGLKIRHVVALTVLRDLGERAQSQMSEALGMDATGIVALLNDLESQNLIERRRAVQDRRRHNVVITGAGCRRLAEVEHTVAGLERRMFGLSGQETTALYQLLQKATAAAAGGPEEPVAGEDCAR